MSDSIERRLEQYTLKRPREVLLVTAEVDGESDQIAVFRGYSSSLTRPTAYDPDVPILPADAKIIAIDRLEGPYNPQAPRYLEQGLTWEAMQQRLAEAGL